MITSLFCFWAAPALTTAIDTISPSTTRTKTIQQRFNHSWKAPTIFPPSRSTLSWSFCAVLLSNWVLVRNKSCMKLKIFTLYRGVLASLCCSFSKMLGSTSGAIVQELQKLHNICNILHTRACNYQVQCAGAGQNFLHHFCK